MKLFRWGGKPEGDQEDKEMVLNTDIETVPGAPADVSSPEGQATPNTEPSTQVGETSRQEAEEAEAETTAEARQETSPPQDNLLANIGTEADTELAAEEAAAAEGGPSSGDEELDPELLDIFRDARNEAQEGSLAAEMEDIPAQELLSDLVGVSQRLGVLPRGLPREPGPSGTEDPPDNSEGAAEPDDQQEP